MTGVPCLHIKGDVISRGLLCSGATRLSELPAMLIAVPGRIQWVDWGPRLEYNNPSPAILGSSQDRHFLIAVQDQSQHDVEPSEGNQN